MWCLVCNRDPAFYTDQSYLRLFSPAFDWLFRCFIKANQREGNEIKALSELLSLVAKCDDDAVRSILIGCFIDQSEASFIADRVMEVEGMIGEVEGSKLGCDV